MHRIGMYRHSWNKYPVIDKAEKQPFAGISVVIAFRNEEDTLPGLLDSLNNQIYPEIPREFILVNDHSDDRSVQIAEDFAIHHSGFHCLTNGEDENGKKAAILKGIRHSAFNFIILTDADCTMGDTWLSSFSSIFSLQHADMIIGLVDMDVNTGLFNRFQEIEFLSLVASGAAAAAGGRPIYCNAANLAFRKDLFLSYADPMSMAVPSGDDTLFMLRVKKDPACRIVLLKSVPGIVTTRGAANIREFFNQRIRWASKSRYYTDRDIIYTAGLVLGISIALLLSALALALGRNLWLLPVVLLAKSLMDYLFLRDFLYFYAKRMKPLVFLLFETIYPVYIIISATMGIFNRYSWKERIYMRGGS
jgi:poly-beta-1,6-N-acetyl-D-glucosamine synthase